MISRKKILNFLVFTLVFLAVVNILAIDAGWYYIYPWFDVPMHFLGGLSAFFLVAYIFYNNKNWQKNKFIFLLLLTLCIGIGWEIYEYLVTNMWAGLSFNIKDTMWDLFFDTLGGLVGISMIKKTNGN